jgi:hypothetical protein
MHNFNEWYNRKKKQIDEREIDSIYDKAHISVELVDQYRPDLLQYISVIANLATGAYGLYNSEETNQIIDPNTQQRLIYKSQNRVSSDQIANLPRIILKQYFPELQDTQIKTSDTIHVNVRRILLQAKSDLEAVLQIGSTIVHEAVHEMEKEIKGQTTETNPMMEEKKFMLWANTNMKSILQMYPELAQKLQLPSQQNAPNVNLTQKANH